PRQGQVAACYAPSPDPGRGTPSIAATLASARSSPPKRTSRLIALGFQQTTRPARLCQSSCAGSAGRVALPKQAARFTDHGSTQEGWDGADTAAWQTAGNLS